MKKSCFLTATVLCAFLSLTAVRGSAAEGSGMLDLAAEAYVKLALEVGAYAPGYIDAYYGPKEWVVTHDDSVLRRGFPAAGLRRKADDALKALDKAEQTALPRLERLRAEFLRKQLIAVKAEIDVLSGKKFSFDQESRLFYDAVAPTRGREEFEKKLAALETALPGSGSLQERLAALRRDCSIPADRLAAVIDAALGECRRRTLANISLPAGESFRAAYVRDKPWGAYNWYKGNAFSVIEVNTDLPLTVDSALGIMAHEGYPGHHVYNALLEAKLAGERGWIEFTIYPLFSPQSLIAEGTANFGIDLLFPGDERLRFVKGILCPLAGVDAQNAERYDRARKLLNELRYAEIDAARAYLDGKMSRDDALAWLERYALETPERAAKTLAFWGQYRSYVINYTLGEDIVRSYMRRVAGANPYPEHAWQVFSELLTTPRTPSGLQKESAK
jgi:hypothetical protein